MYDNLEDKEIFDKLENARLAELVLKSTEWKILKTAFERAKKKKDYMFMMANPKNADEAAQLFYAHREFLRTGADLSSFLRQIANEGEHVSAEAMDRQIITPPER